MIAGILLLITCFGLSGRIKENSDWIGFKFLTALLFIPIALFLLNPILKINLLSSSWLIFFVSLLFLPFSVLNNKNSVDPYHPLFILSGLLFCGLLVFDSSVYEIRNWDEYSHWLLMPKQIFYAKQALSPEFYFKSFISYTPGLPLLANYSNLISDKFFSEGHAFLARIIMIIGLAGVVYDLLRKELKSKRSRSLAWFFIFVMAFLNIPGEFIHPDVLVEVPLQICLAFLFLGLRYYLELEKESLVWSLAICISVVAGVLFKKPFLIALLPIGLTLLNELFTTRNKKKIMYLFLAIVASLTVVKVWGSLVSNYPAYWNFNQKNEGFFAQMFQVETLEYFLKFIKYYFRHLFRKPLIPILLFGLPFLFYKGHHRKFISIIGLTYLVYLLGIFLTYHTAFGDHEKSYFASYDRYTSVLHGPMMFISFLLIYIHYMPMVLSFIDKKLKWKPIFFVGAIAASIKLVYGAIWPVKNYVPYDYETKHLKYILELVDQHNLDKPLVRIVDQKNDGRKRVALRYHSLIGSNSPQFLVADEYAFILSGNKSGRTQVGTLENLEKILRNGQILLVYNTDSWMDEALSATLNSDNQNCAKTPFRGIAFKQNITDLKYECLKLDL